MDTFTIDYGVNIVDMLKIHNIKVNTSIKTNNFEMLHEGKGVQDLGYEVFRATRSSRSHWASYVGIRTHEVREEMAEKGFRNATLQELIAFGISEQCPLISSGIRILDYALEGLPGYIPRFDKGEYNTWLTVDKNEWSWHGQERFLGIRI